MIRDYSTIFFYLISERAFSRTEKQRHDGWFNNLAHPSWGSVGKMADIV